MSRQFVPEIEEPDAPPRETKVRRSGGWFTHIWHSIALALAGSDEELLLENRTQVSWRVYHEYHLLGSIDAGEYQIFRLHKRGTLVAQLQAYDDVGLEGPCRLWEQSHGVRV